MNKLILILVLFLNTKIVKAQWTQMMNVPATYHTLLSVKFLNIDTGYVVGEYGTILKTIDGGENWSLQNSGVHSHLRSVFFSDSNNGIVVGDSGKILTTTNGGLNWSTQIFNSTLCLRSVYFSSLNTGYIVGDNGTILKTINGGINWTVQPSGTSNYLNSICFIDVTTGYAVGLSIILKTTDGGASWLKQIKNINLKSVYFSDLNTGYAVGYEVDPLYDSYGVIYKTTNAGNTWNRIYYDISYDWLSSVFFINNSTGYCVGDGPILKTTDGGIIWSKQWVANDQFADIFFISDSIGYTVTWNSRIFKTLNSGENTIENSSDNIKQVDIYPNPFNKYTTIVFANSNHKPFTIAISDLNGEIKRIYQNVTTKIEIERQTLKSGVYFIQIIGEKNYIKKLLIE